MHLFIKIFLRFPKWKIYISCSVAREKRVEKAVEKRLKKQHEYFDSRQFKHKLLSPTADKLFKSVFL